jgi:hypothetical protein
MFSLVYERKGQFLGKRSYKQYTKTDTVKLTKDLKNNSLQMQIIYVLKQQPVGQLGNNNNNNNNNNNSLILI